jgi:hypothetical protein
MSDRKLPPVTDVFAYWHQGAVQVALHGREASDDRTAELTPAQALRLAETLTRAAREALANGTVTGLEYRGG